MDEVKSTYKEDQILVGLQKTAQTAEGSSIPPLPVKYKPLQVPLHMNSELVMTRAMEKFDDEIPLSLTKDLSLDKAYSDITQKQTTFSKLRRWWRGSSSTKKQERATSVLNSERKYAKSLNELLDNNNEVFKQIDPSYQKQLLFMLDRSGTNLAKEKNAKILNTAKTKDGYTQLLNNFFKETLQWDIQRLKCKTDDAIVKNYDYVREISHKGSQLSSMLDQANNLGMAIDPEQKVKLLAMYHLCKDIDTTLNLKRELMANPYYSKLFKDDLTRITSKEALERSKDLKSKDLKSMELAKYYTILSKTIDNRESSNSLKNSTKAHTDILQREREKRAKRNKNRERAYNTASAKDRTSFLYKMCYAKQHNNLLDTDDSTFYNKALGQLTPEFAKSLSKKKQFCALRLVTLQKTYLNSSYTEEERIFLAKNSVEYYEYEANKKLLEDIKAVNEETFKECMRYESNEHSHIKQITEQADLITSFSTELGLDKLKTRFPKMDSIIEEAKNKAHSNSSKLDMTIKSIAANLRPTAKAEYVRGKKVRFLGAMNKAVAFGSTAEERAKNDISILSEKKKKFEQLTIYHENLIKTKTAPLNQEDCSPVFIKTIEAMSMLSTVNEKTYSRELINNIVLNAMKNLNEFPLSEWENKSAHQQAEAKIVREYQKHMSSFMGGKLSVTKKVLNDNPKEAEHLDYSKSELCLPTEYSWRDYTSAPLFTGEPSREDVEQGGLGDCYLLAGISSVVATHPEKIKEMMRDNGDGTVTVRLYSKYANRAMTSDFLPKEVQKLLNATNIDKMSDSDLAVHLLHKSNDFVNLAKKKSAAIEKTPEFVQQKAKLMADAKNGDLTAQEKLDKLLETAKPMRIYDKLSKLSTDPERYYNNREIANLLANDPDLQPIFDAMKSDGSISLSKALEKGFKALANLDNDAMEKFEKHMDEKKYQLRGMDTEKPDPTYRAIYVTVKKTIPIKEDGDFAYSKGALWTQLIEKAYAASGIHSPLKDSNAFKPNKKNHEEALEKYINQKINDDDKYKNNTDKSKAYLYKQSYEWIEGGISGNAVEALTGFDCSMQKLQHYTAKDLSSEKGKMWWDNKLCNPMLQYIKKEQAQDENLPKNIPSNHEILEKLVPSLKAKLIDKYVVDKSYSIGALNIEDLSDIIADEKQWEKSDEIKQLQEKYPSFTGAEIAKALKAASERLNKYCHENDINLSHRSVVKSETTGKYTQAALDVYNKIKAGKDKNVTMSMGSTAFIPATVKGGGKNGESFAAGFVQRHAYSVLGCYEKDGHRFILIRNPWKSIVRKYAETSAPGQDTTQSAKLGLGLLAGTFGFELNDFMNSVGHVDFNTAGKNTPALIGALNFPSASV